MCVLSWNSGDSNELGLDCFAGSNLWFNARSAFSPTVLAVATAISAMRGYPSARRRPPASRLNVSPTHVLPRDRTGADVVKKATPTKSVTRKTTRVVELEKATGTGTTLDQLRLRLPDEMREKLAEAAMANGRSLNDEIIYRLMQTLEREAIRKKLSDLLKSQGDRLANVEKGIATLVEQLRLPDG